MELNRRDFMKANAALAAAAAAGMTIPVKQVDAAEDMGIKWDKAPCRFCGTGCSVLVGTKDGRVVATQGDPDAEVNRGLNCIKGYFLSKIMYGADRVQTPLLRMKDGKFHKEGDFTPVSWDQAFTIMAEKIKDILKKKEPNAVGMFSSGQTTIYEGYAKVKLWKAGLRSILSILMLVTVWRLQQLRLCVHSVWMNQWVAITISRKPMHLCFGVQTWRKCTQFYGLVFLTVVFLLIT